MIHLSGGPRACRSWYGGQTLSRGEPLFKIALSGVVLHVNYSSTRSADVTTSAKLQPYQPFRPSRSDSSLSNQASYIAVQTLVLHLRIARSRHTSPLV